MALAAVDPADLKVIVSLEHNYGAVFNELGGQWAHNSLYSFFPLSFSWRPLIVL
jgi:hypothetical protein